MFLKAEYSLWYNFQGCHPHGIIASSYGDKCLHTANGQHSSQVRRCPGCNVWSCVRFFSLIRSDFTCPGCKYQCYVKWVQKGPGSREMGNSINWLHNTTCQVCSVSSPNTVWSSTQSLAKDLRQFWSNSLAWNNPKLIKKACESVSIWRSL